MFATSIFPSSAGSNLVTNVVSAISGNVGEILIVIGFMVGLSIVLTFLDFAGFIGDGYKNKQFFKRYKV